MAFWLLWQGFVVVLVISLSHHWVGGEDKDIFEYFQPKKGNPRELNEFLAAVSSHKQDFSLIRELAKRMQKKKRLTVEKKSRKSTDGNKIEDISRVNKHSQSLRLPSILDSNSNRRFTPKNYTNKGRINAVASATATKTSDRSNFGYNNVYGRYRRHLKFGLDAANNIDQHLDSNVVQPRSDNGEIDVLKYLHSGNKKTGMHRKQMQMGHSIAINNQQITTKTKSTTDDNLFHDDVNEHPERNKSDGAIVRRRSVITDLSQSNNQMPIINDKTEVVMTTNVNDDDDPILDDFNHSNENKKYKRQASVVPDKIERSSSTNPITTNNKILSTTLEPTFLLSAGDNNKYSVLQGSIDSFNKNGDLLKLDLNHKGRKLLDFTDDYIDDTQNYEEDYNDRVRKDVPDIFGMNNEDDYADESDTPKVTTITVTKVKVTRKHRKKYKRPTAPKIPPFNTFEMISTTTKLPIKVTTIVVTDEPSEIAMSEESFDPALSEDPTLIFAEKNYNSSLEKREERENNKQNMYVKDFDDITEQRNIRDSDNYYKFRSHLEGKLLRSGDIRSSGRNNIKQNQSDLMPMLDPVIKSNHKRLLHGMSRMNYFSTPRIDNYNDNDYDDDDNDKNIRMMRNNIHIRQIKEITTNSEIEANAETEISTGEELLLTPFQVNVSGNIKERNVDNVEVKSSTDKIKSTQSTVKEIDAVDSCNSEKNADAVKSDLSEVLNGQLVLKLLQNIFGQLGKNSVIKNELCTGGNSKRLHHIDLLQSSDENDEKSLLSQITIIFRNLILNEMNKMSCQRLTQQRSDFLKQLTGQCPDTQPIEKAKEHNYDQENFLFAIDPMGTTETSISPKQIPELAQNLESLLTQYDNMHQQCQQYAEPLRDFIQKHVDLLKNTTKSYKDSATNKNTAAKNDESDQGAASITASCTNDTAGIAEEINSMNNLVMPKLPDNTLVQKELESVGLGAKNDGFRTHFDVDKILHQQLVKNTQPGGGKAASWPNDDDEEDVKLELKRDVQPQGNVGSDQYRRLHVAGTAVRQKRENLQKVGRVFSRTKAKRDTRPLSDEQYYHRQQQQQWKQSTLKNDMSNDEILSFESPLVYSSLD